MKIFGFEGGVHPPERKDITEEKKIEIMKEPQKIYLSLLQHIGASLEPLVEVGEYVKRGQKIADSKAFLSVPVHSPISGKVIDIEMYPFALSGKMKTIIIENDGKNIEEENEKYPNYNEKSRDFLLTKIREMGVAGQGGATFPTHVKLNPPADANVDTLLINAAECEPYLNTDNRVMIEYSIECIEGIKIMLHILGIKDAIIALENNKPKALEVIKKACENTGIKVVSVPTKYPQGGEKQLIKSVLNRIVPSKKLPSEVGVVVQNIATAKAVYDAVVLGKPLIERVVTISGAGIKNPSNLLIKIGTLFRDILEFTGFDEENTEKIVMGGPMMGIAQYTKDVPVVKGTSGILALTSKEVSEKNCKSCISCAKCVNVCPMNLMPLNYDLIARAEKWEDMDRYNLMDCIECGSCSYVCPAKRPLTEAIKIGKAKLRSIKK